MIELRRDAMAEIVLNQLYRFSPLQSTFGVNTLALDRGKAAADGPQVHAVHAFIEFREEVIRRRTVYELKKARERAHVSGRAGRGGGEYRRDDRADPRRAPTPCRRAKR